jgi:hypothetical protein
MSWEQSAPLYYSYDRRCFGMSYATGLGGHPCVLACRLLRGLTGLLLNRVNTATAVVGP